MVVKEGPQATWTRVPEFLRTFRELLPPYFDVRKAKYNP